MAQDPSELPEKSDAADKPAEVRAPLRVSDLSREEREKYQELYGTLAIKAEDGFDRMVATLSGGALGISLTIIDKLPPVALSWGVSIYAAWFCWVGSLTCSLDSYPLAAKQFSQGREDLSDPTMELANLGGKYARAVASRNLWAGRLFKAGLIALVVFLISNGGI